MIKRLAKCIREYKKSSILTPAFISLEVVMETVIPLIMAKLIDLGIEDKSMKMIWLYGGIISAACLISLLFGALSGKYAAVASAGFAKNLRHDMYYKIQDYSFSNIDKFSTASLVTRLTTDVTNIQNAYQMIIRVAVRCPMMLIFGMVMSFSINSRLALIFACALPVLGGGMALIITKAYPVFSRMFTKYDGLTRVVQENLHGIRVVKSFVREKHETEKFGERSEDIYRDARLAERIVALNSPLMMLCIYGCMLAISWFGAKMIVGSTLTTGELTSMITYTMQILMSLMMLSLVFVMITMSRASAKRVCEVLGEKSDITDAENPVMTVADGSVSFKNVGFSYSKDKNHLCLSGINIDIKSGETVGIIGGTGSSKTSLIQLISRLYDVTEGCVLVGGTDVRKYDIEVLRNAVGTVLQKNLLFSGTIKDNLRWGNPDATEKDMEDACRAACAHDFITAFPDGYDTLIEQGGTNVSGGQNQRLCIARALLKHPKILILDDSTSAVDTATDSAIRKAFAEYIPGTTKIIIAQRITSVEHADNIIVMDDGKISSIGTHDELIQTSDIYREVYNSQTKGENDL